MHRRFFSVVLVLLFAAGLYAQAAAGEAPGGATETAQSAAEAAGTAEAEGSYGQYLSLSDGADVRGEAIVLPAGQAEQTAGSTAWTVDIPQAGRYHLKVRYRPDVSSFTEILRRLLADGAVPYRELDGFALPQEYRDDGPVKTDIYGNEIRPQQVAAGRITENYLFDYAGAYSGPLSLCLTQGAHRLTLEDISGKAEVIALILVPAGELADYSAYAARHAQQPVYTGEPITLEAERSAYRSDQTLYAVGDKSSPLVSPSEIGKIRLNTVGGYRWATVHQYIVWNVTVPSDGLYTISFKVRQNVNAAQRSGRILYINGEIPFREAAQITVPYSTRWQRLCPGDGEWRFYLHEGVNEIRLEATLGQNDATLRTLEDSVQTLNTIYRKLLIVIGPQPDTARDYKLDKLVPEQLARMAEQAETLRACADALEEFNGGRNAGVGLLHTMERQLKRMSDDPDKVAGEFSQFRTNIGALGTWLSTAKQQPLSVDCLTVGGSPAEEPPLNAGWFAQTAFDLKEFLCSFVTDYRSIGEMEEGSSSSLKVWVSSGRDQAQVLRSMISDSFTPAEGIHVQLELVANDALLPAVVAGTGPDVSVSTGDVINFAMRHAACDLTQMPGFAEVAARFPAARLIPLRYVGGIYALPENLAFSVLFYRTDILAELGLSVPETWDDVRAMTSVLSKNNMEFGLPAGNGSFLLLLRQSGVPIYEGDGISCLLDQPDAVNVFRSYTALYANYGLPLSYDLVNRFRTGEMPVAVADFGTYNTLSVAAPEIRGLWAFTKVPGTPRADDTVDHTTLAGGSAAMLLTNAADRDAGWTFLKWWTSPDVQARYARELESVLGPSGRYTSAATEAFARSSWSAEDMRMLQAQLAESSAIEQVPGGYLMTRHLDNAFRNVVYNAKDPMDMLFDYVYKIDRELTEKRQEFGLPVAAQEGQG